MVKIQFMVLFYQFYLFTIAFGSAPSKECSSLEVELSKPGGNCIMINTTSSETEKGNLDPMVFINVDCPDHIQSYWLNLPPFAFKNASNRNQTRPFGAFVDIIQTSLTVCCTNAKERHFSPNITFDDLPTKSIKELHQKISSMKVSGSKNYMAMPLNVDKSKKYLGKLDSLPVMVSPADVVLVKKSTFETSENNKLWQSIQGVFLAILLAVLLSLVAGVCIWALETRNNPDEFPRSFARGTSEGFWWAFVTMTTVGYGDRTPKSLFGRLFGIVWIVFGISLFSIVTAAMTSGLMASLGKEDLVKIRGKDVAVLEGSPSVSKAIKAFAIPKVYSDLESMRKALLAEEVEAILVDMFTGFYLLQHSKDKLHVGNLLENPQYFGIVFWKKTDNTNYDNPFPSTTTDCLKELLQNHERDVYKVMDKYFERTKKKVKPKENVGLFSMNSPFFKPVFVVLGVLCGLILVFAMVEVLINRTKMADDQIKGETAIHRKEECGLKQLTSKEQSKISKSTELL